MGMNEHREVDQESPAHLNSPGFRCLYLEIRVKTTVLCKDIDIPVSFQKRRNGKRRENLFLRSQHRPQRALWKRLLGPHLHFTVGEVEVRERKASTTVTEQSAIL